MQPVTAAQERYGVVDLFSGPGGLGEGFSAVRLKDGTSAFPIALSVEMERSACETLRLRSFLRHYRDEHGDFPDDYYSFLNGIGGEPDLSAIAPDLWARVTHEVVQTELGGSPETAEEINRRLDAARSAFGDRTILIGGPPCQAYSLVGRSRNRGIADYDPVLDRRHFLYQEYIRILGQLRPAVFVMENVKGLLSSQVGGGRIFENIITDLQAPSKDLAYRLMPITAHTNQSGQLQVLPEPRDFIVRAEEHGVPQARHRVIIVGVRHDLVGMTLTADGMLSRQSHRVDFEQVVDMSTFLRSGISRCADTTAAFQTLLTESLFAMSKLSLTIPPDERKVFDAVIDDYLQAFTQGEIAEHRTRDLVPELLLDAPPELATWLLNSRLTRLPNHETRAHIPSDLRRYLFAAIFAEAIGRSPKATDFPQEYAPSHANWESGKFADRFRVQRVGAPATTITSHISKDGHYYIHPDPRQCRSLTVREAARLQTFPDDYFFKGSRTQQYHQVGNAVPPFLAWQIGRAVRQLLDGIDLS